MRGGWARTGSCAGTRSIRGSFRRRCWPRCPARGAEHEVDLERFQRTLEAAWRHDEGIQDAALELLARQLELGQLISRSRARVAPIDGNQLGQRASNGL